MERQIAASYHPHPTSTSFMGILIRGIENAPPETKSGAVTIGNFDGVHRGHRTLVERLVRMAEEVDGPSIVLTFDPPPSRLLRPDTAPPALTWMERRADLLFGLGVDAICVCETRSELLELAPEDFFNQILIEQLAMQGMVEGPNFRFGKDRCGDVELLSELCAKKDITLSVVAAHTDDDEWISSSRIRQLVGQGDVAAANRLLLEPYRICGVVGHGAARGRQIGFPTANLESIPVLIPAHGVYAGRTSIAGETLAAAVNIGPNPTFGEQSQKVEVHLVNYRGDLYGSRLEVEILEQLRGIRKFEGVDDLKAQLRRDVERTCEIALPASEARAS
jgi:riboflavin kinase/FMN adenylyltransferase